jgi:hypothetical protein
VRRCKKDDAPTTPSAPTTKTDTFTGNSSGEEFREPHLHVETAGQVSVTLTAASPPSTIAMGIAIGTPANSACGELAGASVTNRCRSTAQLTGVVSPACCV